jgi:hypothetical protein
MVYQYQKSTLKTLIGIAAAPGFAAPFVGGPCRADLALLAIAEVVGFVPTFAGAIAAGIELDPTLLIDKPVKAGPCTDGQELQISQTLQSHPITITGMFVCMR